MSKNMSRKYINFLINRKNKKLNREKHFTNLKEVSTVLVLISSEGISKKDIDQISQTIGDKKITYWILKSSQKSEIQNTVNIHLLDPKKDISFLQKPKKEIEKKITSEKYDLLIDLTTKEELPLKYLLGISNASCRCGMKKDDYTLYDLEIAATKNISKTELLKQILFYLGAIRTKL
jgi:hypothetical protein